jgi:hypothetical protein
MIACCCSMAGTKACLTCPQYQNMIWPDQASIMPNIYPTRKTTEKYDKDGKIIERIIEE